MPIVTIHDQPGTPPRCGPARSCNAMTDDAATCQLPEGHQCDHRHSAEDGEYRWRNNSASIPYGRHACDACPHDESCPHRF